MSEEQKLWQYALYSAAVLKGVGKLFIDYDVNLYDNQHQLLKRWNPLLESLSQTGSYYDYDLNEEGDVAFRVRLNLLLARSLMPPSGFNWIAANAQVLAVWLALINEDPRGAGTLGVLLVRADALAIQRYFEEFMNRSMLDRAGRYARMSAFSDKSTEGLREKEQMMGMEFLQWLSQILQSGQMLINKSPLFSVPGGLLICSEAFQWFVREHPEYKNWQAVQNGFLALGLHQQGSEGAISRFEQEKTQHLYSGVVFTHYAIVLPDSVNVQLENGKTETLMATELIHKAQYNSPLVQKAVGQASALQKLSADGQWQAGDLTGNPLLGAKHRG
jgi:hypothetical protein